ncbi:hypothetical protein LTR84_008119 [Exophiala bonariae]|uniref:Uncharacterized protein n=1 Tax=Exophiala bonariae TaxID=1690606 RepID=A0AAV9NR31_9EURO|nr:hypothetical protein LTR84_008119 [Exophiala bonariae]
MNPPTEVAGKKRKVAFDRPTLTSQARKRQKAQDARAIPTQRGTSVSANGELNIASFIKAREFEISALDKSMRTSRNALTSRAFQQVPRHMRRRTASHNAKKVPRRLRRKAEREMTEDNTPIVTKRRRTPSRKLRLRLDRAKLLGNLNQKSKTVRQKKRDAKANAKKDDPENHTLISRIPRLKKNTLTEAPRATVKYKKRQVNKTWLPTHLWHTKRAHMTRPTEPLWRIAIPLRPTEKSYRPSHRAAGQRGCIAWDCSYMSSVACRGTESAIQSLLGALGFVPQSLSAALQKKWKSGTRFAEGWVHERDNKNRPVAPVRVLFIVKTPKAEMKSAPASVDVLDDASRPDGINQSNSHSRTRTKLNCEILIQIHPSAFHQFWSELITVAKVQKPQVLVEDLRFELGSIEVQGPGSTEALLGVLRPVPENPKSSNSHSHIWRTLAGLNNPGLLPQNALLSFDIADPRLNHPPTQIRIPNDPDHPELNEILVNWPVDNTLTSSRLFSHKVRFALGNSLPSQKAISRRRALTPPGQSPTLHEKDPQIPVILLASRAESSTGQASTSSQGKWTVLLPWFCVDLVWRSLMYYPLSSGGTPRFGGLNQKQQLAFEQQIPWFPADFPGTEAGKAWDRTESERKFDEWIRRPPKSRVAWDKLDLGAERIGEIGRGWACDWEFLFESGPPSSETKAVHKEDRTQGTSDQPPLTQRQRKAAKAKAETEKEQAARRRNTSSPESEAEVLDMSLPSTVSSYTQLTSAATKSLIARPSQTELPAHPALLTIRITFLDRGTPTRGARIYRLPTTAPKQVSQPIDLQPTTVSDCERQTQPQQLWSSGLPPAAQRPPPTLSTADNSSSSNPGTSEADILHSRWLALVDSHSNGTTRLKQNEHYPKPKINRFGMPATKSALPRESLFRVNVLPKNAPKEIIDKYGPDSAYGRGDGEIPKIIPQSKKSNPTGGSKKSNSKAPSTSIHNDSVPVPESNPIYTPSEDLLPTQPPSTQFQLQPQNDLLPLSSHSTHKHHPPVPHAHDLIGFVTTNSTTATSSSSAGYNLSEGRGTAIGSIWAQRVVEGWDAVALTEAQGQGPGQSDSGRRHRHGTRFLCIVRNAGESVGRLARWEVCG